MALSFKIFVLTFCITTPSRTDAADLVIEKFVGQRDMYFGTSGVVTYANISPVSCAVKCKLVGGCLSFGYNSALKRCDIHKSDFGTLMVQQDWVFYNWKGFDESNYYNYYDEIASAVCAAKSQSIPGYTFPIRASPSDTSCDNACTDPAVKAQDPDFSGLTVVCAGAMYVGFNRTRLSSTYQQDLWMAALVTYWYPNNDVTDSGEQNYCCCVAYD